LMDLFLSKGCKITDKDDGGNTPLLCAVRAGKMEIVVALVKMGADVNVKNDFDDTPMKIAEDKGLISIISFLGANGAKPTKKAKTEEETKEETPEK
jgi:ankyrin repeat protein